MAQKINPISFRLGKFQVWGLILQNYGKTCKFYSQILHKQLKVFRYLNRVFYFNNLSLNYIEWSITKNKIYLNIYGSHLLNVKFFNFTDFQKEILLTTSQLLFLPIYPRFYFKTAWYSVSDLLVFYICYLTKQDHSLHKIINNVEKILNSSLNLVKISYFKNGPTKMKLIGFKIRLAGRFENTRNQMAKVTKSSLGLQSLTSLQYYTEYSNKEIFTKFGTCGLQIWLFYKIY